MTNRRECLKALAAASALVAGLPGALAAAKRISISLDLVERLKTVGGSAYLKVKERELIFIRDSEETVKVLDPLCTHKKCTVEYDSGSRTLVCPCHGSQYALSGKVLKGPAKAALTNYEATLADGQITISLED